MPNPDVWAPTPQIEVFSLPLKVSGTPLVFTTNFRIWAARPVFKADGGNGFEILIGKLLPNGSVPTAIVKESPGATEVIAIGIISAGGSWEPPVPKWGQYVGQQFQLKQFVAQADGGGVDQRVHVEYTRRTYGVTS